jgi:hypothetical protein
MIYAVPFGIVRSIRRRRKARRVYPDHIDILLESGAIHGIQINIIAVGAVVHVAGGR